MGHRALVAYERPDGSYNLHYSHWGARNLQLKQAVTPETPLGNGASGTTVRELLVRLLETTSRETGTEAVQAAGRIETQVEPRPVAVAVTRETILQDYLDYLCHEAFYEIGPAFEVTAYRTLWLGLEYDCHLVGRSPTVGHGAIRTVEWHEGSPVDEDELYGTFRGMKTVVGDMIDRGVFAPAEGLDYLEQTLVAITPESHSITVSRQDGGIRLSEGGS